MALEVVMAKKIKRSVTSRLPGRTAFICIVLSIFHLFATIVFQKEAAMPAPWSAVVGTLLVAFLLSLVNVEMAADESVPLFGAPFFLILASVPFYLSAYLFYYGWNSWVRVEGATWGTATVTPTTYFSLMTGMILACISWTLVRKINSMLSPG